MIFDIIVILAIAASAAIAWMRGFTREVLTILGIVGGLAAAYVFGPISQPVVRGFFGAEEGPEAPKLFDLVPYTLIADVLTYGSIFVLVVIVLSLLSHWLSQIVSSIGLGSVDRTMGVAFGIVRGVVLLAILYLPVHLIIEDPVKEDWFKGSRTQSYIAGAAESLAAAIPGIKDKTDEAVEETTQTAEKAKETHDFLSKLGLLGKDSSEPVDPNDIAPGAGGDQAGAGPGYNDKDRQGLESLIEQKSGLNE